jgi:hypothetical protein
MLTRKEFEHSVESTYKNLAEECFGGLYSYCYQTGSFIYGGGTSGKSDLDITILFKNSIKYFPERDLEIRIKKFVLGYLDLHFKMGYMPDTTFPGEYVTEEMFADAIAGRGFHVGEDNKLYLPKASPEYYLADPERWFRAWLSQSAFCKFLTGDQDAFKKNKVKGWGTILKFVLKDVESEQIDITDIFNLLRSFGVHKDYYNFVTIETPWVIESLDQLARLGFLVRDNEEQIHPNKEKLKIWEKGLARAISSRSIRDAEFIFDLNKTILMAKYASDTWIEIMSKSK